jgi:uncharacterized protein YbaP (TraB family)
MTRLFAALLMALAPMPAFAWQAPSNAAPAQAAAAPASASQTPPADANPALWVVRDSDTTIYLFGTIHLLDGRPWFNDEVRTAFDASDELIMEAIIPEDPASLQPMVMRYAVDPNGRRLSSRLTRNENRELGRALAPLGLPPTALDRFEPWFVSMTLSVVGAQRLGVNSNQGPETVLSNAARARHMTIGELEGFEWQIRLFDTMPESQQLVQLRETLAHDREVATKLAPMLAAWSSGDVDRLAALMDEDEEEQDRALHQMLFTNRNANWAHWIQQRMARPGTVFIAVGAGHLAGRDSVQAQLRTLGLNATRVPHVATAG